MSNVDSGEPGWERIGVAAALAQGYAADQKRFVELLAQMLEGALPGEARVERGGGLFGPRTIKRLKVDLNDGIFVLDVAGRHPVMASWSRVVRGIALKTEPLAVEEWLVRLGAALDERARASATAREALARILDL